VTTGDPGSRSIRRIGENEMTPSWMRGLPFEARIFRIENPNSQSLQLLFDSVDSKIGIPVK